MFRPISLRGSGMTRTTVAIPLSLQRSMTRLMKGAQATSMVSKALRSESRAKPGCSSARFGTTIVEFLRERRRLFGARLCAQRQSQRAPRQEGFGQIGVASRARSAAAGALPTAALLRLQIRVYSVFHPWLNFKYLWLVEGH